MDLLGEGSNLTSDNQQYFSHWSEALVESIHGLDYVILAAHSTGGMSALATPELQKMLIGLVVGGLSA